MVCMPKARRHDDQLRARLLSRAAQVVSAEGAGALSLRALAAAEGTSTSAIYSLFGGKDGLLLAIFRDGFARFAERQRAVPRTGDAVADLFGLGRAYFAWAREHPHLFAIMFGGALGEWTPPEEALLESLAGLSPLSEVVAELPGLRLPANVAVPIVWGAVHGVIDLAGCGALPVDDAALAAIYEEAMVSVHRGITDSPSAAGA